MLCGTVASLAQIHLHTPLNKDNVLAEHQWKGHWIGIDHLVAGESIDDKTRVNARYLRTEFELSDKPVKSAKVFIATVGYYELFVNGERIGEQVLAPVQTDSRKSIIYDAHDVAKYLSKKVAIGVILGNGRGVPMRYSKHYKCPFMGFPKCRVELLVEYADGSKQRVSSSNKWKATTGGAIRSNNEYDGEVYDARKELKGWTLPDFDDSDWQLAERTEIPLGTLYPQTADNQVARVMTDLPVKRLKDGVFDVGQNMAGWINLRVRGHRGDTIRIKYAERVNPDSTLYIANLRDAETEDTYVCNGEEGEGRWWHPTFVYHGFRYVRVSGMENVSADDIQPVLVADKMDVIGSFASSNDVLNRIYRNAVWGIIDNYKGFPVDCPQRNERQPWLGDRTVGSLGESYVYDNNRMYTRWMRDICDAQRYDGCIPDVAPAFWNYYSDDVTWPACLPFTCQMLYEQFGNDEAIRNSYPYIRKWIAHICDAYMKDGIITKDKYGDWCMPPERPELIHSEDPARQTDGALISTAYMIHIMQMMERFANMQGLTAEASDYAARANAMTEAFNRKFLTVRRNTSPVPGHPLYPDSIYYGNNTATANVLALAFDIVPKDYRQAVVDNVVRNIITDNGGHVSCGVIGISHLLRTLTANGRGDVAYLIATNTSYPSWGYMAEHGATTIWELWNGDTANPAMNSGNHVMLLGDLLTWMYQDLAGIKNAEGSVGYRHLMMKPDFTIQDLDSIDCSYCTPQGLVVSRWKKSLETLDWTVTLPAGTVADVCLPDNTVRRVGEGTHSFNVRMPLLECKSMKVTDDEFVYDHSMYPETHASSIIELPDGALLATYFGGTKERNPDVCIYTQRKEKGDHHWQKPVFVADGIPLPKEGVSADSLLRARTACWNPVLFQMPDGESWLFFKIGPNVAGWTGWLSKSKDGGRTWSAKEQLPEGFLGPIKNKPILIDNKLLCPSSTEADGWKVHFEWYDIATGKWTKTAPEASDTVLCIQPSILIHGNNTLQALARTRPTNAQRKGTDNTKGRIAACWSYDNGRTWTPMSFVDVPNNQSGLDAVTLAKPIKVSTKGMRLESVKGTDMPKDSKASKRANKPTTVLMRHALIYNDFATLPGTNKGPRTPLSLALSPDGVTWYHVMTLEDSPISQYSYPSIIQGADGSLHCIYTWRRQRIAYKRVEFR